MHNFEHAQLRARACENEAVREIKQTTTNGNNMITWPYARPDVTCNVQCAITSEQLRKVQLSISIFSI